MSVMPAPLATAELHDRALIRVGGAEARPFLHNLLTQDLMGLAPGALRYGALLTPQGRLAFEMFLLGEADGVLLDTAAAQRDALLRTLTLYRLRAPVRIEAFDAPVLACWRTEATAPPPGPGWAPDPRLPELGWRTYAADATTPGSDLDYDAHRLTLGVADPVRDRLDERTYPIEANFDLLNGIDFKKGCFVGQETTSRMKRRGQIKTRMVPIAFDGPALPSGAEVLAPGAASELRAGEVRSSLDGLALALMRLDRAAGGGMTVEGRPVRIQAPAWLEPALQAPEIADRIPSDQYA